MGKLGNDYSKVWGLVLRAEIKRVAESERRREVGHPPVRFRTKDKRWLRKERKRLRGEQLNAQGYKGRPKAPVKMTPKREAKA